jgi:transketolase
MRHVFAKELYELVKKDKKVFVIIGDVSTPDLNRIAKDFPKQFLNFGIMEQSMVSFAAGMSLMGFKVYVYTTTPFVLDRAFEQIKLDVAYNQLDVKIVGYADFPEQGPTHSEANDQIVKYLKMKTFYPKSEKEVKLAVSKSYATREPVFISLKKLK